ncbi:hypothetical protein C9374_001343 [Naegleria lovaniensis]|uniref:Chromatin modification-related protein EAF6 n=1 Tax=Naegleria lovaniensis TaxID=51637 RepID=A0AA88GX72_NAELO|nr:uncharacterized protein C9374_001343 [Naegleria lovaniensis]KAG2387749.1 hypothetical protein C9374_001343 [Naegleria lovaniensis]
MERLLERKQQLEAELKCIQDSINRAEEVYFQDTLHHGNIIKGFEGYLKMEKGGSSFSTSSNSSSSSQKIKSSSSSSSALSQFLKNNKNRVFSESSFAFPRPYPFTTGCSNSSSSGGGGAQKNYSRIGRVEYVDDDSLILDPVPVIAPSRNHHLEGSSNALVSSSRNDHHNDVIPTIQESVSHHHRKTKNTHRNEIEHGNISTGSSSAALGSSSLSQVTNIPTTNSNGGEQTKQHVGKLHPSLNYRKQ